MKTMLAGLLAVLVLASLLIVTIQAEDMTLSSNTAETSSLVTERWGANSTAEYPANTIDTTLNGLHPDWGANNGTTLIMRSGGGYDGWALLYFDVSNLPVTTTIRSASLPFAPDARRVSGRPAATLPSRAPGCLRAETRSHYHNLDSRARETRSAQEAVGTSRRHDL